MDPVSPNAASPPFGVECTQGWSCCWTTPLDVLSAQHCLLGGHVALCPLDGRQHYSMRPGCETTQQHQDLLVTKGMSR